MSLLLVSFQLFLCIKYFFTRAQITFQAWSMLHHVILVRFSSKNLSIAYFTKVQLMIQSVNTSIILRFVWLIADFIQNHILSEYIFSSAFHLGWSSTFSRQLVTISWVRFLSGLYLLDPCPSRQQLSSHL